MSKLVTKIFAITIGVFIFSFGLLLLVASVLGILKCHSDINLSLEGSLAAIGILSLLLIGFYLMWISYSMLVLKKVTDTSMLMLICIPSIIISFLSLELLKKVREKPEMGYSFLEKVAIMAFFVTVLATSFFFISKTLVNLFRQSAMKR